MLPSKAVSSSDFAASVGAPSARHSYTVTEGSAPPAVSDEERTGVGALEGTPCAPLALPEDLSRKVRALAGLATAGVFLAVVAGNSVGARAGAAGESTRGAGVMCAAVGAGMVLGALVQKKPSSIVRSHFVAAWVSALLASGVGFLHDRVMHSGDLLLLAFATTAFATLVSAGLIALSASLMSAAEAVHGMRAHDGRDLLVSGAGVTAAWLSLPLWLGHGFAPLAWAGVAAGALFLLRGAARDRARLEFLKGAYEAGDAEANVPGASEWRVRVRVPWAGAAPTGVRQVWTELGANMGLLVRLVRDDAGPFRASTGEVAAALVPVTYEHARKLMRWRYLRSAVSLALAANFHTAFYFLWSARS